MPVLSGLDADPSYNSEPLPDAAAEPDAAIRSDRALAVRPADLDDAEALRARIVELATAQLGTPATRRAYRRGMDTFLAWAQATGRRAFSARSEERRVGKECRSRWSPYH